MISADVRLVGGPTSNKGTVETREDGDEADLSECILKPTGCETAGAASCHGEGYLGCFAEKHPDPVLSGIHEPNNSNMTISYCIDICMSSSSANYTYAGVERGYECFCGEASDNYTLHGIVSDDYCDFKCSGDPTESCGGVGFIAIFTIHVETSETTPAVVSTAKVDEVTIQLSSEMTSHTRDAVTSSTMTTLLSTPTTLQQNCNFTDTA
ncbi:WSC domain-containing protein 1-like [Strongylocentrotus purpuratus]|uniref:WSC domain-containing protein n=1 Tax=Strongylocentrotus purpuratus TaxID=7668 RepID=A0A7M7NPB4_STRPU|nr:WSC domain-containing protein 1-like [Strongylocentrotus purpuratus]